MLESLLVCSPLPDEVLVVDGDASESSRTAVEGLSRGPSSPRIVDLPSSRSLTRQRHAGLAATRSEVVIFIDDDMSFRRTPELFQHVRRAFAESDVVGVTGQVVESEPDRAEWRRSRVRRLLFGRDVGLFTPFGYPRYILYTTAEADVEYMPGVLLCVCRDLAQELGFDERLSGTRSPRTRTSRTGSRVAAASGSCPRS